MPHKLNLITDTSTATIDALADSYASSFGLNTFYPALAQYLDIPNGEYWHLLQLKQVVYQSLVSPQHEVWAILDDERLHENEYDGSALRSGDVAAIYILKLPGAP